MWDEGHKHRAHRDCRCARAADSGAHVGARVVIAEAAYRVRPAEQLGEHIVEVRDEICRAGAQIFEGSDEGSEARALERALRQNGEQDFDLVQPRAVARRVDEANLVGRVLQNRAARLRRLADAGLALLPEGLERRIERTGGGRKWVPECFT